MTPLLDIAAARVLRRHLRRAAARPSEGVAVAADGAIWCGTETGDLIRIEADGSSHRRMASTGGFLLGIAFDSAGNVYACDLRHAAVFRYEPASGRFDRFASSGIRVPNYPVVDEKRGVLYVTDSRGNGNIGPGLYRFDLATGEGGVLVWTSRWISPTAPASMRPATGSMSCRATCRRWCMCRSAPMARRAIASWSAMAWRPFRTASRWRRTARSTSPATSRAASTGCKPGGVARTRSRTAWRP